MLKLAALDRTAIAALVPHQGAMCLLDRVLHWDAGTIECAAVSHLDPANPLRRAGRLSPVCGVEYGLQAAALHGGLLGGETQPAGLVVALRAVAFHTARLDDPAHGQMRVLAMLEQGGATGQIYRFRLHAASGACLLEGRGTVALPPG